MDAAVHRIQGPLRFGRAVHNSRWFVGCLCGWKTMVRGNKEAAKQAWRDHG